MFFSGRLAMSNRTFAQWTGRSIRDWVAGNHSQSGFWKLIRDRYIATQVIFECKNYNDLSADDFAQVDHYLNDRIGPLWSDSIPGGPEIKPAYYSQIKEIAIKNGLVLLLGNAILKFC